MPLVEGDDAVAAAEPTVRLSHFVTFNFASGAYRLWSGFTPKTFASNEYSPAYGALQVSDLDFSASPTAQPATVSTGFLDGIDDELLGKFLDATDEVLGRTCSIVLVFMDADWQPISSLPAINFTGYMQPPQVTRTSAKPGEPSTQRISMSVENVFTGRARNRAATYSDTDQKSRSPTDRMGEFVGGLQNKVFRWPDY